jgi:23S rRNA (uridine2552-2'-O)-methyltransferase
MSRATVPLASRKERTESSRRWLLRQLNDPYVQKAKNEGYRSRAAYKLIDINAKYRLLKPTMTVVDLGAAPGGWTQVIQSCVPQGTVIAVDSLPMEPLKGVHILEGDFTAPEILKSLEALLPGPVDGIFSDMAPSACGRASLDHLRIMTLLEEVLIFSRDHLAQGGFLVAKVFRGGTESTLLRELKTIFTKVMHVKPPASRQQSTEMYVVATGFRGRVL